MPIEVELAPHVVELLDFYWDRYRPRLAKDPAARWVFPGVTGGPKVAEVLAKQIGQTIRTETGLTMNVHLFRHLAAKLVLQADEGSYETARLLLGHRSLATTVSAYTGTEHAAAFRRYDRILDRHRVCRA